MPATVKRSDGSSWGISEELGRRRCPFSSKKRRKRSLISGLRTPVSRGMERADSTRSRFFRGDSHRGGIAEFLAKVIHGSTLQARDMHLRYAQPLGHLGLRQLLDEAQR